MQGLQVKHPQIEVCLRPRGLLMASRNADSAGPWFSAHQLVDQFEECVQVLDDSHVGVQDLAARVDEQGEGGAGSPSSLWTSKCGSGTTGKLY